MAPAGIAVDEVSIRKLGAIGFEITALLTSILLFVRGVPTVRAN
jgi:hypothetical protein